MYVNIYIPSTPAQQTAAELAGMCVHIYIYIYVHTEYVCMYVYIYRVRMYRCMYLPGTPAQQTAAEHTSAYVSIRQHTYVCIDVCIYRVRQHNRLPQSSLVPTLLVALLVQNCLLVLVQKYKY
jgi:hypothetical protein